MPDTGPPSFSVDTGLFRQLGELLVGRDSTALVELVKNAYDADATEVVVTGRNLSQIVDAQITVADNGTGMTIDLLKTGFLRVAATGKTRGQRRSLIYLRRFTGEKGVGRLAAHKLATRIDVTTVAAISRDGYLLALTERASEPAIEPAAMLELVRVAPRQVSVARIDWNEVERYETLDDVKTGISIDTSNGTNSAPTGTTIELRSLRHAWSSGEIDDLVEQLRNFEPPRDLVQPIPKSVLSTPLIFSEPRVRDSAKGDPGMRLSFDGEIVDNEQFWNTTVRSSDWILEVRAERGREVQYSISPTRAGREKNPHARPLKATYPHPSPEEGPFFDGRIFLRPGSIPTSEESWAEQNSGIRVYLEGFRVLPYGASRNDWLSLNADYTRRSGRLGLDPLVSAASNDLELLRSLSNRDVSLRLLSNRSFFGAIFLTEEGAGGLRTLVNREGFVPDQSYERLVNVVATGTRLLQRSHALASYLKKQDDANMPSDSAADQDRNGGNSDNTSAIPRENESNNSDAENEPPDEVSTADDSWRLYTDDVFKEGSAARFLRELSNLETAFMALVDKLGPDGQSIANQCLKSLNAVRESGERLAEDASLLRVLASVGTQLAAYTHELAQLVPSAIVAEQALAPQRGGSPASKIVAARTTVSDLRRALERQAAYLVEVGSTEGRRRRRRQPLRDRVDVTYLVFRGAVANRKIELSNNVPEGTRTPPMFASEIQAILTNLVSNAIKAAGDGGRVCTELSPDPKIQSGVTFRIHNTGKPVLPAEAESWFRPYASSSTTVDPALGQGMGLGLPITRDLLAEYGGTVQFIEPAPGFATTVEVVIPE